MNVIALVLGVSLASAPISAWALCSYGGIDNAKTTVGQEFADSRLVVRAKLVVADYHWSDEGESWTTYKVRVLRSFKGRGPSILSVFTYRDSGGFYLDKGASPDMGGDYLLFLVPATRPEPRSARGAMRANYACGQSKPWAEVTAADEAVLARLSRRH